MTTQTKPKGVPSNTKFSHTVWGVSKEGNALAGVSAKAWIPRKPTPVYIKQGNKLHF